MTTRNTEDLVAPLKKSHLFERVAQELADLILIGELKTGAKLPSEHDLAKQFGVSRNVVREGLRSLIERGLVAVRPGDGIYVQAPDQSTVVGALSRYMQLNRTENWVDELYEVRRSLEAEIAALAAERATPEDIESLEASLECMRLHTDDPVKWARADWDFHQILALASHNSLFPMLLEPLYEPILRAFEEGWRYPKAYENGLRFHAAIIEQVRAHALLAAREIMLEHLEVSYRDLKEVLRHSPSQEAVD